MKFRTLGLKHRPMRLFFVAAFLIVGMTAPGAAQQVMEPQGKVAEFVKLLHDPDVQTWLQVQPLPEQKIAPPSYQGAVSAWELETRDRIDGILSSIPEIPREFAAAAARVRADAAAHRYLPVSVIFAGIGLVGILGETLFRRWLKRSSSHPGPSSALGSTLFTQLMPIAVFALCMTVIFLAFDWPALARIVLLVCMVGYVGFRLISAFLEIGMVNIGFRRRLRICAAIVIFGMACASIHQSLGIPKEVSEALSYLLSIPLLILSVQSLWTMTGYRRPVRAALTLFLFTLWVLWAIGFPGLFWLGVYALALPKLLNAVGRVSMRLSLSNQESRHQELRDVLISRGSRAVVMGLAIAWLAAVWRYSPESLAINNPTVAALLFGLLKGMAIVVVADIVWHIARAVIDRRLKEAVFKAELSPDELARRSRLRTLLPIFRNALAAVVMVTAGLMVLSAMGVEIAPLIAGAGIFGVAIGFGSQTLVKDVISGVFYMLDDAFRVGEYIQSGNYKGTVESFSLRSVRLRHHRGAVFTVPFGLLGAVQNMSRDWVIDKFRISVDYDTDIEQARKIAKSIGAQLLADPEVGPLFIEPLKMRGVEEFGDYGIVLGFGMTVVPGQQTYIRRKAYMMIHEAFKQNGIEFAQPTVQVGDDKVRAAAAAMAIRAKAATDIVAGAA